jgi:hypothetical protein
MVERSGVRRSYSRLGSAPASAFNDEFYGRRMQLLTKAGAGRFLDTSPDSLIGLAMGSQTDDDMLDEFLRAYNQAEFNQMRQTFEAMPEQIQTAEFNRLPRPTREVLVSAGYQPPEDSPEKSLWKRIFTWDIPLLPEEHFGKAVAIGAAPLRAMGFLAGTAARNVWEHGVMKPSRFATRLGRTGAYLAEIGPQYNNGTESFINPARWREAWNNTKVEENSYYAGVIERVTNLIGDNQTDLLRAYLADGQQAVYDKIADQLGPNASPSQVNAVYQRWYSSLGDEENVRAREMLSSGRLTLNDASVRAYNHMSPWDVRPDSAAGKTIGMVGALATEILLDPTTWVGGAYIKIAKRAKAGLRVGQKAELVDFWRRVAIAEREAARQGNKSLFAPIEIYNPVTGRMVDAADEVAQWVVGSGAKKLAATNMNIRLQARAMNRFIDKINDTFRQLDELEEFSKDFRLGSPDGDLTAAIADKFGDGFSPISQLLRDVPAVGAIWDDMVEWHRTMRRYVLTTKADNIDADGMLRIFDDSGQIAEVQLAGSTHSAPLKAGDRALTNDGVRIVTAEGEIIDFQRRAMPTLADEEGYWTYLQSKGGWEALSSRLGKVDPEAIWLPKIGKFGEKWIKGKKYMREVVNFDNLDEGIRADMARLAASYLSKQTNYVHQAILDDIADGTVTLSKKIDDAALRNVLDDATVGTAEKYGLGADDLETINTRRLYHEEHGALTILEDGEMSGLLNWYQDMGYDVIRTAEGKPELVMKAGLGLVPFRGAAKAAKNYYRGKIHRAGGQNAELTWWEKSGAIPGAAAHWLMYYPARFAEKLTTYVPRAAHLDVTDPQMAVSEFMQLVDMGVMSDMSRTQIDNYVRAYAMGNPAERWLVTTEFYLDFLGRSGALLHGGRDVQRFVEKFIRHGAHRYGNISEDFVGLHGLNIRRAIIPGEEFTGQLARGNILPNYRELAAVSRYMAFYRMVGHGIHLPWVDNMIARTWRPAVLLRLGYVARNGGEELFTWMMREGPAAYGKQKLARSAADIHRVYDPYGRAMIVKGKDLTDAQRIPMIWKPFSRLWRSFNEVAGVGDLAITTKAIREAIEKHPGRWAFMTDEAREVAFNQARKALVIRTGNRPLMGTSRRLLEYANVQANKLSKLGRDVLGERPGMVTREKWQRRLLRRVDKQHEQRVEAVAMSLTNPTMLDAQMRDILGTFDNYLNYEKNTLDTALRSSGAPESIDKILKMTLDYENTQLMWVSTEPGTEIHGVDKSIAMAQRLGMYSDDPASRAYIGELIHYVTDKQEAMLRPTAERLLAAMPERAAQFQGKSSSEIVLTLLREHEDGRQALGAAFDLAATETVFDDAGHLIIQGLPFEAGWPDAIDDFLDTVPEFLVEIWDDLLNPKIGGIAVGQDPNLVAFLIGGADPTKLSSRFDEVRRHARIAYANYLMTPEGQQMLRAVHRSNTGFSKLGPINEMLPPGATRLYVPMLSIEYRTALVDILSGGGASRSAWFDDFTETLVVKLRHLGIPEEDAIKAARLLSPSIGPQSTQPTASSLIAMAGEWAGDGGTHFPLTLGSANDRVALAISQSLEEVLERTMGGPIVHRVGFSPHRGRIASMPVNNEELFNSPGAARAARPDDLDVTIVRNGVASTTGNKNLADISDVDFMNNYYGWGEKGATRAVDMGPKGLSQENVVGIAGGHLLYPRTDGLKMVPMVDGEPLTYVTRHYRNKVTGEHVVLRVGDERDEAWFFDMDLIEEQVVPGPDLRQAAEDLALRNSIEIDDLLGSGSRQEYQEIFHPWAREVLMPHDVSPERIGTYAQHSRWWSKAPDNILGFMPASTEMAGPGEKISKAWTTLLRNWFDGVVNPMIGAMVREPLFQHHLVQAFEQTVGVRRIYHRKRVNGMPHDQKLQNRLGIGTFDDDAQLVIEELEGFVKFDWPLAGSNPEAPSSALASSIEIGSPLGASHAIDDILSEGDIPNDVKQALKKVQSLMKGESDEAVAIQNQFFSYMRNRKLQFETHRDIATRRAMTLTSAYIDDHRIRSQFQAMVGTIVPFWFAEDNFLRRIGRSLQHNPLMLRNAHLMMNAGVYSGLIQEDQFGEKKIVIPGSEVLTHAMLSIADELPIVQNVFGGELGSVARPTLAMSIRVIPGYDLETIGRPGFGPLLAAPINFASGRDPEIRAMFEHNLVGGRYSGASKLQAANGGSVSGAGEAMWSAVVPAVIFHAIALTGFDGPNGEARAKAKIDVLKFMAMNGAIPDEAEIAAQSNPSLFQEEFLESVDMMARQYQLLQGMSWFFGPATAQLADLTLHENWEWNNEFHELLEMGMPYEEAYPAWVKNIEATTGEKFDPVVHSPFRTSAQTKIPFAVLETTQDANVWLTEHDEFTRNFRLSAPFFMPRKFDVEDDEYVAEAKQRQINMGLRKLDTPQEFLSELYFNISYPTYFKRRSTYLTQRNIYRKRNQDTAALDRRWNAWYDAFKLQHPVFTEQITTGTARVKRDETVQEFRLLIESPSLIPEGLHRDEIISMMGTIVGFANKMEAISGVTTGEAQRRRDALRYQYLRTLEDFVRNKPWLNELYYSVFLPLIGESWIAKNQAGLVNVDFGMI